MKRIFTFVLVLAFLNGCSFSLREARPLAVSPGATAFSAGYGESSSGSSDQENGSELDWPWVVLGVGALAALFGTCFALKSDKGRSICFSILDAAGSDDS